MKAPARVPIVKVGPHLKHSYCRLIWMFNGSCVRTRDALLIHGSLC